MVWGPPRWLVDRDLSWVRLTVDSALRLIKKLHLYTFFFWKSLHTLERPCGKAAWTNIEAVCNLEGK